MAIKYALKYYSFALVIFWCCVCTLYIFACLSSPHSLIFVICSFFLSFVCLSVPVVYQCVDQCRCVCWFLCMEWMSIWENSSHDIITHTVHTNTHHTRLWLTKHLYGHNPHASISSNLLICSFSHIPWAPLHQPWLHLEDCLHPTLPSVIDGESSGTHSWQLYIQYNPL